MTTDSGFVGAKLALIGAGRVLTCLRDDREGLNFPGFWDLPGGGREGSESPEDCVLRELREEFGLVLPKSGLLWRRDYASEHVPGGRAAFFGGRIEPGEVDRVVFGDEGQGWQMMEIGVFVTHARAVPYLRTRLQDFLSAGVM